MSPFAYRTLVTWDSPVYQLMLGHGLLKHLEKLVMKVQLNLKEAQDLQKRYLDKKRKDKYYQLGDHVYLKVKEKWSSLSLGRCGKLPPIFCRPFEILSKRGPLEYELVLPAHIRFHNFFPCIFVKEIRLWYYTCDWLVLIRGGTWRGFSTWTPSYNGQERGAAQKTHHSPIESAMEALRGRWGYLGEWSHHENGLPCLVSWFYSESLKHQGWCCSKQGGM